MAGAVAQWMLSGTGPLATNTQDSLAFVRVGDDAEGEALDDSTSGKGAPDVELMCAGMAWRVSGFIVLSDASVLLTFVRAGSRPRDI